VGNKPERDVGRSMDFRNTPVGIKIISLSVRDYIFVEGSNKKVKWERCGVPVFSNWHPFKA